MLLVSAIVSAVFVAVATIAVGHPASLKLSGNNGFSIYLEGGILQTPLEVSAPAASSNRVDATDNSLYSFGFDDVAASEVPAQEPASRLTDRVKDFYMSRMARSYTVNPQALRTIHTELEWRSDSTGSQRHFNIAAPNITGCVPVLSPVEPLHAGIFCPAEAPEKCEMKVVLTLSQEYASTVGMALSTTISSSFSVGTVDLETSITTEKTYEETWTVGSSSSAEYVFPVAPGGYCVPSMVHVDLECELPRDTVWFDTWWDGHGLHLARESNRKGGPYANGQHCRVASMSPDKFFPAQPNWQQVDPKDANLGLVWRRPSSELNRYLGAGEPPIGEQQLVIRPAYGDAYSKSVFVCDSHKSLGTPRKVIVPLKTGKGNMLGFVSCVNAA
jgi:hypothetical protein